jgi:hypothetical protein
MRAALAAVIPAALAAAVVMLAASVADMAAADIGKQLRLSSKRLVCFGRRAFTVVWGSQKAPYAASRI